MVQTKMYNFLFSKAKLSIFVKKQSINEIKSK